MQESFDPDHPDYEFYGERNSDSPLQQLRKRLQANEAEDRRHSKRRLRILLFDILIIALMFVVWGLVRPKILAQTTLGGYRFRLSTVTPQGEAASLGLLLQASCVNEAEAAEKGPLLTFEWRYGEHTESFSFDLPTHAGEAAFQSVWFPLQEGQPPAECRISDGRQSQTVRAFAKKFPFF